MVSLFRRYNPVIGYLIVPVFFQVFQFVIIQIAYQAPEINFRPVYLITAAVSNFYPLYIFVSVPVYYYKHTKKERFKEYETMTIEYDDSKKIFVSIASMLVIFVILDSFFTFAGDDPTVRVLFGPFTVLLGHISTWAVIGAGLRILIQVAKKESRFYLAKGYCRIATKKEDEFEKSGYLSSALDSYNKYLRRRSHIEIKNIKRIYAAILMTDTKEKNKMIKSICESLEGDKLKLARYLSSVWKVPETDFFVGESIGQKLKVVGTFFAAAIPIIISVVQLILRP